MTKLALNHTYLDTKAGAWEEERLRLGLRMFKPQTADWLCQELQRGVLCRKGRPLPGTEVLWQAFVKMRSIVWFTQPTRPPFQVEA